MIEVQNLSRWYGDHQAVDGLSFRIGERKVVGFLGSNGAGKSTTLKILAGLLPPSAGTVRIDGVDLADAPASLREKIGFLPEDPPLYLEMTVTEFLQYLGGLRGMSGSDLNARIPEVLRLCQLEEQERRVISELSHGYRKRVGIAQAILHKPKLVILDEPISGLDPKQIRDMRDVIRALGQHSTVLISSHILTEISQTCDAILMLDKGRMVAQGSEAELAAGTKGSHRVALTLSGSVEAVDAFLASAEGVRSFDRVRQTGEGHHEVLVSLEADTREALVAGLVGAGLGVRRVTGATDELEDIYLQLTQSGGKA